MRKSIFLLLLLALALVPVPALVGCGGGPETESTPDATAEPESTAAPQEVKRVVVRLEAKSGVKFAGAVKIGKIKNGVMMGIDVTDAPPGEHAVHLHEVGDCSADDATSAGGHWNPTGDDHGKWGTPPHHLGDVGNLVIGDDYKGELRFTSEKWSLGTGEENDIIGKAIIVHAAADDFTSQPTGAAGGRIACGVIR